MGWAIKAAIPDGINLTDKSYQAESQISTNQWSQWNKTTVKFAFAVPAETTRRKSGGFTWRGSVLSIDDNSYHHKVQALKQAKD